MIIALTRSLKMKINDDLYTSLVPFWDMCNHGENENTLTYLNTENGNNLPTIFPIMHYTQFKAFWEPVHIELSILVKNY